MKPDEAMVTMVVDGKLRRAARFESSDLEFAIATAMLEDKASAAVVQHSWGIFVRFADPDKANKQFETVEGAEMYAVMFDV